MQKVMLEAMGGDEIQANRPWMEELGMMQA